MSGFLVSTARRAASVVSTCLLLLGLAAPALAAPTISVDDVTITEGDTGAKTAVFTVSLSAPSATDVGFRVGTAELSAVGNDDFQHYYSSPYTIPAGQTTYTLNLVVFGDKVVETDETFEVRLENVSNATVAKGVGIGTILDDDAGAGPTLSIGDQWVTEGNAGSKAASFTVQLSQVAATDVSFSVATANGTASAGSDYTAINLGNQVIPAGQLRKTITVNVTGDTSTERDESFVLNLANVSGATPGRAQGRATIGNDDAVSAVKISVSDAYVEERDATSQTLTFHVNLSQPAASTVTFDLRTEDSSATAGNDYLAFSLAGQTLSAGQTSKQFTVTVLGDNLPEAEERLLVTLSNVSTNASVEYNDPHGVGTIANDDAVISIEDASMLEGDGGSASMAFKLTLSAPLASTISFRYVTCDVTATAIEDYWTTGNSIWQFPGGATSMNVYVPVNGDLTLEPDETFCVDLVDVTGADVGDGHAVGTIINDDVPVPVISIGNVSMTEGDSGFEGMHFPLTLSSPAKTSVYINAHTEACGDARPDVSVPYTPGDYVDTTYTNISIPAGSTSGYVYVDVRGDVDYEPDEQFCVRIDTPNYATLGNDLGVGTIVNNDAPAGLSVFDTSTRESLAGYPSIMTFGIGLSKPVPNDVTFDVRTDYGTAIPDVDFTSKSEVGLKIPAGSLYVMFQVTVNGDDLVENDETFTLNVSNVVGAPVLKGQGVGTIINDDKAELRIEDATFTEGNDGQTTGTFVITLSHPMPNPVTFDVATGSITATAGSDFVQRSKTGMMIDPGRTRAVFEVQVLGDTEDEADEQFAASISNWQGAEIGKSFAWATLLDDDAPALTSIAAIQGANAISPLSGQSVGTEGVVTALTAQGFFVQSAPGREDGDAATSEGLFVASGGAAQLRVGDAVRVHGRVQELRDDSVPGAATQTQLAADALTVLSHDQALPRPVQLQGVYTDAVPPAGAALERFEGMRVAVPQLTVLAPSGGSVDERTHRVRSDGRFYGAVRGADGRAAGLRIASAGQAGAVALSADRGDLVTGLVGVLAEASDAVELLPDPLAPMAIASRAHPVAVDRALPSEATIGSLDLRRFLDDVRQGAEPVPAADAYATRLAKTANAVCAYARSPAILALQDVENTRALDDLAAAVNSRSGNVLFEGACTADPGYVALRDAARPDSRVGLLVSTAPVRPGVPRVDVRSLASLAAGETFAWRDGGREPLFESAPLLAHARINGAGGELLEVQLLVARLDDFEAPSASATHGWATRADYVAARRAAQARALTGAIRTQQRLHPRLPLVLLTDADTPASALGLGEPMSRSPARYSVIRDGRQEAVDRVLVSRSLLAPAFGAQVGFARINADFGEDNYGDAGVPTRVSDHDPVVLFLRMR